MFASLSSAQLWHILFEITLFGLVGIVCYQLYTTYVRPALVNYIRSLRTQWKDLHNKKQLLEHTRKNIEDDITKQQKLLSDLHKKITLWYKNQRADINHLIEKRAQHAHNILEKRKLQANAIVLHKTRQEVIPRAVDQARNEFLDTYAGKEGDDLLSRLINRLEEQLEG